MAKTKEAQSDYGKEPVADLFFRGEIRVVSPVSVSIKDAKRPGVVEEIVMVDGTPVMVPVIRGETIKGILRTMTVEAMTEQLGVRFQRVRTLERNLKGGIKSDSKESPLPLEKVQLLQRKNPIASLFGIAEPCWMPGKLEIFRATTIPEHRENAIVEGGFHVRRGPVAGRASIGADICEEDRAAYFKEVTETARAVAEARAEERKGKRQLAVVGGKARAGDEEARDKLRDMMIEQDSSEKNIKLAKGQLMFGEQMQILASKPTYAIAEGVKLEHRFNLRRATLRDIGALLRGLER